MINQHSLCQREQLKHEEFITIHPNCSPHPFYTNLPIPPPPTTQNIHRIYHTINIFCHFLTIKVYMFSSNILPCKFKLQNSNETLHRTIFFEVWMLCIRQRLIPETRSGQNRLRKLKTLMSVSKCYLLERQKMFTCKLTKNKTDLFFD